MKATIFTAWVKAEDVANIRPLQVVQALDWGSLSPTGHYEVQVTLLDHDEFHAEHDRQMAELMNNLDH